MDTNVLQRDPATVPAQVKNPAETPNVTELIAEFKKCSPWSGNSWNRVRTNEDIRFCRWNNQWPDGRKRNTPNGEAFPWDGASDQRVMLADDIIGGIVAECFEGFWRAWMAPKGGEREEDGYAIKLANYFVTDRMFGQLFRQVELSAQYRETYGWVALHPTWEREVSLEYRTVRLQDFVGMGGTTETQSNTEGGYGQPPGAGGGSTSPLPSPPGEGTGNGVGAVPGNLASMILDPSLDDQTAPILQELYGTYAAQQVQEIVEVSLPPLSIKLLKKAIVELREKGETEVPIPYVCRNEPAIYALKPWEEFFVPGYTADGQRARVMFHRVWMSELDVRSKVLTEGWSQAWVEEAVKHKGKFSTWSNVSTSPTNPPTDLSAAMNAADITTWSQVETKLDLIEVIYCSYRQLDENNVPGIYLTIVNPMVLKEPVSGKELCALHELQGATRGRMPYVIGQRENVQPNITASRGVPEILNTYQRALKVQVDGATDWTSIGVLPPVNVYQTAMKTKYRFGPAVQNIVQMGKEPKFMEVPGNGVPVAFDMMDRIEYWVDRYFGRANEKIPPSESGSRKQMVVGSFLLMWSEAIVQTMALAQHYMPDAEFADITGAPAGWLDSKRGEQNLLSSFLHFDVRELDPAFVTGKLDAINKTVLPGDVGGVIDRTKYTQYQLRSIDPILARSLVADQATASQQLFDRVKGDVMGMFQGVEPQYVEMDPTAPTKLQYLSQLVKGNPNYMESLQKDPKGRFAELMQKYVMNLQFSVTQEENKKVGAIGVKPGA